MKIIVDAFGGDYSPVETVLGAVDALNAKSSLKVVLVGDKDKILSVLDGQRYDAERVEIVHAPDVVTNDDVPTTAIKTKKDSSLVKGLELLASDDDAAGFVSAGSTGAVLVGAYMKVGRIKGVSRPALAPALPTVKGTPVILCDCGANVDCKPLNLLHFAIMASAFSGALTDKVKPTVGLLSNGAEDKKGNELNREAFELLKSSRYIDFKGNCEARDLLSGDFDVVVCDGFNGNIALKSAECTANAIFSIMMEGVNKGGLRAKLGALMLKPVLRDVKHRLDYNNQGGACFLGVNKVVVKSHGASKRKSICASILQAATLAKSGIVEKIKASVQAIDEQDRD